MLTADVLRQYHALTKPRVIQLIVFCALIGMVLAIPGVPSLDAWIRITWACLGIWLVAGAAAAFNCLVEKTLDAKMRRTAWRPTARGELSDAQALGFSAALCSLGSFILYVFVNPLTMWLTFATFIGYAVIYTLVLKPMTPQNIVIGGAAGAMPVLVGWAAVTNSLGWAPVVLFVVIFLWTPPHFWALAIRHADDYKAAGVPMMPVVVSLERTVRSMTLYAVLLTLSTLVLVPVAELGWIYGITALVFGVAFVIGSARLGSDPSPKRSMRLFTFSITYVTAVFVALTVDVLLR